MDRDGPVSYRSATMKKFLASLLLLAGCASPAGQTLTSSFPTRVDATEEQFLALLDEVGWRVAETEEDFHRDPRGFVGTRYVLERNDGKGMAELFLFDFEVGNGSLMVEVTEEVEGGSMVQLIEGLRRIYDAGPTWRDRGVLHCLDHQPPHAVECPHEENIEQQKSLLRAEHGCLETKWNPR